MIASPDMETHERDVREVLRRLDAAKLIINAAKCRYAQESVVFLGHKVDKNGIAPDPEKVTAIENFPQPKTVNDLRRFMGMVNLYRRTIPYAANIQRRLQVLIASTKKNDKTPVA